MQLSARMRRSLFASSASPVAAVDGDSRPATEAERPVGPPQRATTTSWVVLALALLAVVMVTLDVPGPVRAVVVVMALLTAPGLALLPRPVTGDPWARAGMTVALSVVVGVLVALASVWSGWWHPRLIGAALLLIASGMLTARHLGRAWPRFSSDKVTAASAAQPPTPLEPRWLAVLDDGREVPLTGTVPVGRQPAPSKHPAKPLPRDATTSVLVEDATRSVSRGHLRLEVEHGALLVVDQNSANGTTVTTTAGQITRCSPGDPVPVHDGDIVSFGAHWLTARYTPGPAVAPDPSRDALATRSGPARPELSGLRHRSTWLPAGVLVLATLAWIYALTRTSTSALGVWGLLPAYPLLWYVSVAAVLGVLAWGIAGPRSLPNGWMAAYGALLVLMLYGSATFVATEPRLPWIYKHIAVTRYIELYGSVDPSIDLYQRWPGFFAWTAQLAELTGLVDPIGWAGLAEPFFAVLDALLVLGVARHLSRNERFSWTAALLFCLGNWVNQNYFAPQALAYCLYLLIVLLLVATARATPGRLGQLVERLVLRVVRPRSGRLLASAPAEHQAPDQLAPSPLRRWALGVVIAAFFVIVATHQLTPYLTLLVVAPLLLLGFLRPAWLTVALVAIAVGYLVPNLPYIQSKYGLFSGFDPVANAVYSQVDRTALPDGERWSARSSYALSGILYLTALVGLVRRARAGAVRSAVVVAWMTLAPMLILVVQSYGGEGRLRVFLFSLPWCAMAAAWAFFPSTAQVSRLVRAGLALLLSVLATLFTVAYFAPEAAVEVPASDIAAAEWMDENAQPGDVLLAVSPIFPSLIGPHYEDLVPDAEISRYLVFYPDLLTRSDVVKIGSDLVAGDPPERLLIVFSDHQATYAARHQLYRPGELVALETQIARAASDRKIFDSSSVRIYQVG